MIYGTYRKTSRPVVVCRVHIKYKKTDGKNDLKTPVVSRALKGYGCGTEQCKNGVQNENIINTTHTDRPYSSFWVEKGKNNNNNNKKSSAGDHL